MSTRSKRTSKTTVTTQSSSAETPSTSSGTPRRERPPSPTMISRREEKAELAGLNDRLAAYIDKMRSLENENARLTKITETTEETHHREITNIKGMYENELAASKALLDETSKEKAKLQVENGKLSSEVNELREKFSTRDREYKSIEKRLYSAESQVNDLQARLNDAVGQRKRWEDDYNKLKKEYDNILKQLESAKKQLEDETIARVDLENRIQSLKEDLAFKTAVHQQEMNETIQRSRVEVEETDGRLAEQYESRLAEQLAQMREDNDEQIRITRMETEDVFERKLAELRDLSERNDSAAERASSELRIARKSISDLSSKVNMLESENSMLKKRVSELEDQLARESSEHQASIESRDSEIRKLRQALEDQLSEYRDLLDVKIQLDAEIAAYRKMLELEETRLNISSASEATPSRMRLTPSRSTPLRSTPFGSRKRKRTELESAGTSYMSSSAKTGFSSTSEAKGSVEVYETDESGKFVKLYNNSEKEQSLGGWQLRHLVGEQEGLYKFHRSAKIAAGGYVTAQALGSWQLKHTSGDQETIYKFHRSSKIGAGQYVTIWSADSGTAHNPPTDLVMKGQTWFIGDNMKTSLLNNQGDEMASREMSRSVLRTRYTSSRDETDGAQGDPAKKECIVM